MSLAEWLLAKRQCRARYTASLAVRFKGRNPRLAFTEEREKRGSITGSLPHRSFDYNFNLAAPRAVLSSSFAGY